MADGGVWDRHYRDEVDAVYLYRRLAEVERDPTRRDLFERWPPSRIATSRAGRKSSKSTSARCRTIPPPPTSGCWPG